MKKIKFLSLFLILPIMAAFLLACSDNTQGGTDDDHKAETYFQVKIDHEYPFVPGHVLISPKDPAAELTVEDFSELDCESVTLVYKTEVEAHWLIVLTRKTEDETVVAIDKLTYRSDLNYAEPNYIFEEE